MTDQTPQQHSFAQTLAKEAIKPVIFLAGLALIMGLSCFFPQYKTPTTWEMEQHTFVVDDFERIKGCDRNERRTEDNGGNCYVIAFKAAYPGRYAFRTSLKPGKSFEGKSLPHKAVLYASFPGRNDNPDVIDEVEKTFDQAILRSELDVGQEVWIAVFDILDGGAFHGGNMQLEYSFAERASPLDVILSAPRP